MLKVLVPSIMLLPMAWLIPFPQLWSSSLFFSFAIAFSSLYWLLQVTEAQWLSINMSMATDSLSSPLLILTCWLLPLMIVASQNHISSEPQLRQRTYLTLLILLQVFLIMTFSMTELIMFYMMFEATLIPTLMIITRWGTQMERLNAGTYFMFYTLVGSMPLLVALLITQSSVGSISLLTLNSASPYFMMALKNKMWWVACLLAFLVKLPLYGLHLWLPKAHVEAPIAGSMILAAILLKLGGYGMMRIAHIIEPLTKELNFFFIILALWGLIMTSSICLRQTDLKSLIAYSSVSHMGLVAAGILIQTPWGFSGALVLMIAHGLTSSVLFCLANTNYERTHSRTMTLARGLQMILPLMASWWFIASLANLALPPLPNLLGELLIVSSLFNWDPITLLFTGLGMLLTATYTLFMFLTTQRSIVPQHLYMTSPSYSREHLLMALHLIPLLTLSFNPQLIMI